jgi:predicted nucleic acid-binding protein
MTRYLLDTDTISNATKPLPSPPLTEWMAKQVDDDLFICSLSLAEIYRGILEKPSGKKRRELEEWFKGPEGPQALFRGRVLAFDEEAALTSHVPGHARRATEECSRHGRLRRSGRRTTALLLRTTKSTFPA